MLVKQFYSRLTEEEKAKQSKQIIDMAATKDLPLLNQEPGKTRQVLKNTSGLLKGILLQA